VFIKKGDSRNGREKLEVSRRGAPIKPCSDDIEGVNGSTTVEFGVRRGGGWGLPGWCGLGEAEKEELLSGSATE